MGAGGSATEAAPGGVLIVHDFMLEDDHHGAALAVQWFLQYLAYQPDACSFSAATLSDLLGGYGFVDISSQVLIGEITKIVLCKKPL